VSESRDFIYQKLAGDRAGSVAPPAEQQGYLEGAPGAESEFDEQDEEQEAADQSIALPATWPAAFWSALTPEAQAEYEAGDHDLVEEYALWTAGEVDTGPEAAVRPPEVPAELPPTADEAADYGQQWLELAHAGGDDENSAGAAFEQARAWQEIARSAAIAEVQAGRRQSWELSTEDEKDVLQAEVDRRVQAGRERYGADR
jgi:hypothetical protein